ncbi:MAG: Gfo/Idh/MocA family oxidoreductase [Spirulinaceae cyanobacterium RM2_2_10]|nr:Gfo/Idh/MocA family oxidoreductase [Spirulinaceae cyanobacterium SM2_1_0]NJO20876.1 Gfo/Idh/MocA family oxidoreductase [Spirulinaceae cyanobacterium RM2_2_10]
MQAGKIGVAVVGTGFGKKIHIPGFQHHHQTEVAAVYHRDRARAAAIAAEYQIPHADCNLETLLARPEVQAVSIATPPFLHYEMARQVLQAGKHLLLEKPMTLTAAETRELYHLAAQQGVSAVADFEFRFIPAWQHFAELLRSGTVGQPRLIKIDWLVASRADPQRSWNWYAQRACGGGALGAIGSHAFDYIHWLFGPVQRLSAWLSCAIPARPDPLDGDQLKPVDADDTDLLTLELVDGTPVQVSLSSVTYQGRGHWLEVYGDRGTLVLGSRNLKDYVHGFQLWAAPVGEELAEVPLPERLQFPRQFDDGRLAPFIRVVNHWVQGITSGQTTAPTLREGVYSQLLMDLAQQASDRRVWLDVPDLDELLATG